MAGRWMIADAVDMECYEFDPDGDVTLILEKYEIPEEEEGEGEGQAQEEESNQPDQGKTEQEDESSDIMDSVENTQLSQETELPEVSMRVSSRHMVLASPVFAAMLSHCFKEGVDLKSDGKLRLALPEDNSAAFSILLNIIHGRLTRVPRLVTLQLLVEIAVLVDKYQLQEVVMMFSELWMSGVELRKCLPTEVNKTLAQWLFLCYVFDHEDEYHSAAETVWTRSTGRMSEELLRGLAIPQSMLDHIESRRLEAISGAMAIAYTVIEDYQGPTPQCKNFYETEGYDCDGMVLGGIIKRLFKAGLWPQPKAPFIGISFQFVRETLLNISVPTLCAVQPLGYDWDGCRDYRATIRKGLHDLLSTISVMARNPSLIRRSVRTGQFQG